jgi:CRP-like cAMP-binding protein
MLLGYPPGGIEKFIPNRHHRHEQRRSFGRSRPPPAALTRRPSDKTGEDIIPFTQEFLSKMLGVRRGTVSALATRFEAAGSFIPAAGRSKSLIAKA